MKRNVVSIMTKSKKLTSSSCFVESTHSEFQIFSVKIRLENPYLAPRERPVREQNNL